MPIYEFYCPKCDTVYNFFSRSANTEKIPSCPRCKTVRLKRQVSLFARISGKNQAHRSEEGALPSLDEAKMEKAMAMLARESGKINEDDPRQAAQLMRKLTDTVGINLGQGMEEALSRLEKGGRSRYNRSGNGRCLFRRRALCAGSQNRPGAPQAFPALRR